ncbi:hypothetical protein [Croceicoccus estronivorus]|uniref:hypothetical protein n=1 Tax=Croceicoccus estronivorus TaxID=1172626 RepID=UPI0019D3378B|nr:hypothetical protein [Croceicoccus estronivorus]
MTEGSAMEGLRPVGWPELIARFSAACDLRHAIAASREAGRGSFDRSAAHHLHHLGQGKQIVNPDGLGDRKARAANDGGDGINAGIGDRGTI